MEAQDLQKLKELLQKIAGKDDFTGEDSFQLAQWLADLDSYKNDLEILVDDIKDARDEIEGTLMDKMSENGVQNINTGERTIYIHRQYWAGYKSSREELVEKLKQTGLDEYVRENYNTHSLSAFVRERIEEYEDEHGPINDPEKVLPEPLREEMKVSERVQLRSRKA